MTYLDRMRGELACIAAAGGASLRTALPPAPVDFSSNDYLGLAGDERVVAALRAAERVGSGGSRLLGGAHAEHAALERALAEWTGREAALLFSSGYLAALGAITALARCVDVAYSDALVHACVIDGLRLTKLERHIVPHAEPPQRGNDARAALIVTESAFGMDGSRAPLPALVDGCVDATCCWSTKRTRSASRATPVRVTRRSVRRSAHRRDRHALQSARRRRAGSWRDRRRSSSC